MISPELENGFGYEHRRRCIRLPKSGPLITPFLLKRLTSCKEEIQLEYQGYLFIPFINSGNKILFTKLGKKQLKRGNLILVNNNGILDLMRILKISERNKKLVVGYDAVPNYKAEIEYDLILGKIAVETNKTKLLFSKIYDFYSFFFALLRPISSRLIAFLNGMRRIVNAPSFLTAEGAVKSVLDKYDAQFGWYVSKPRWYLEDIYRDLATKYWEKDSKILVIGSGYGREAIGIAKLGFDVLGIDLSEKMVEKASEYAKEQGVKASFEVQDALSMKFEESSFNGVFVTADVYNFLPKSVSRENMLINIKKLLNNDGYLIFSTRKYKNAWHFFVINSSALIIKLKNFCRRKKHWIEFGDWHGVYPTPNGEIKFSYSHYFLPHNVKKELSNADFKIVENIRSIWIAKPNI